jgi:hypothetical protein
VTIHRSKKATSRSRRIGRTIGALGIVTATGGGLIAGLAGAASAQPTATTSPSSASGLYRFSTVDDAADPTFNQLLGVPSG